MPDTCHIFRRAQELAYDGTFPLAGNPVIGNFRLGPLADLLTAVPIWITARMEAAYVFLAFLYLTSIPIFYLAVRGWLNNDIRVFAATTWFSFFPIYIAHLITPWNTSYLNVFLAIYALILLRYPRGSRLLLLYGAIGLCIQCHFTCITLIPASMIFLHTHRTDLSRNLPWHLGGMVLIGLLHLPLIWHYLNGPAGVFSYLTESVHGALKFNWVILIAGLTAFPLAIAYPVVILSTFLLKSSKSTAMSLPRGKGRILSVSLPMVIMIAAMEARSSKIAFRYYYPLLPFVSLYTGYVAEKFVLHAKAAAKLTGTMMILVITGFVIGTGFWASNLADISNKLEYQKWLADKIFSWMRQHDWQGSTEIVHRTFGKATEGTPPYQFQMFNDDCIETMIRFRHRDEFHPRKKGKQLVVISIVEPKVPFGNPRSWVETVPGTIPANCEDLGDYGDIGNLICPAEFDRQ